MTILAWIVLGMIALDIVSEPFYYGKPRLPHGAVTWVSMLFGSALLVPLCGRVLGWW